MATKRAKKAAKAKPRKTDEPEPFFRPFAKLKPKKAKPPPAPAPSSAKASSAKAAAPKAEPKQASKRPQRPAHPVEAVAPVDAQTFAVYMAGVTVLADRATRIPLTASRLEQAERGTAPPVDHDAGARAKMGALVQEGFRFETVDDGDRVEGRRLDVDPRELRRLRRAQYAIDGKLDLHGLAVEEARRAVEVFVKKRAVDGDKVVAIVHGKGTHSPRQHAVLRGEIGAWLSQGRVARHIQAFATAPADEGGAGAVLVLLCR
jgi:DNA-nicking Smr family endonuclease